MRTWLLVTGIVLAIFGVLALTGGAFLSAMAEECGRSFFDDCGSDEEVAIRASGGAATTLGVGILVLGVVLAVLGGVLAPVPPAAPQPAQPPVVARHCAGCGTPMAPGARFCAGCGRPLA